MVTNKMYRRIDTTFLLCTGVPQLFGILHGLKRFFVCLVGRVYANDIKTNGTRHFLTKSVTVALFVTFS